MVEETTMGRRVSFFTKFWQLCVAFGILSVAYAADPSPEVLRKLAVGMSRADVAAKLGESASQVETQWENDRLSGAQAEFDPPVPAEKVFSPNQKLESRGPVESGRDTPPHEWTVAEPAKGFLWTLTANGNVSGFHLTAPWSEVKKEGKKQDTWQQIIKRGFQPRARPLVKVKPQTPASGVREESSP